MLDVEQIGPHRLVCGDITDSEIIDRLMDGQWADVIYSDPPWGPGNQKYWHTMNERGSVPQTDWNTFLMAFAGICARYRKITAPVFVEMGLRWIEDLDSAMTAVGLPLMERWQIFYGPKKKPNMNTVGLFGAHVGAIQLPDPPHGEPVTKAILEACVVPGDVVLDPCTGLGMTARVTSRLNGIFYGSELNQTRLKRTAGWLKKRLNSR